MAIVAQLRQLPEAVGRALPVSHHRRLIAVTDVDLKSRLATQAVSEKMSVKDLEAAIATARHSSANGRTARRSGRHAIPAHLKSLRRLPALVQPLTEAPVTIDDVQLLGVAQMQALKQHLEEQIQTLMAASDEITAALEEFHDQC